MQRITITGALLCPEMKFPLDGNKSNVYVYLKMNVYFE